MKQRFGRITLGLLASAGLIWVSQSVDWTAALHTLERIGVNAPLVLLSYALVITGDTLGWRAAFEHARRIPFAALWRARLATDAISNSLPAGVAVAEALRILIVQRRFGLNLSDAAANALITKLTLAISQGLFLVLGMFFAVPTLQHHSRAIAGRDDLGWLGLAIAFAFLISMLAALAVLTRGDLLTRVFARLEKLGGKRLRGASQRLRDASTQLDHSLAVLTRIPRTHTLASIGWFLAGWLAMALDDYVILRLLSIDLPFASVLSIGAVMSVIRILFFFVPSGLGAQELGYYALLRAYGVDDPTTTAAAFMIVKRSKDILWYGAGYLTLASLHFRLRDVYAAPPPNPARCPADAS